MIICVYTRNGMSAIVCAQTTQNVQHCMHDVCLETQPLMCAVLVGEHKRLWTCRLRSLRSHCLLDSTEYVCRTKCFASNTRVQKHRREMWQAVTTRDRAAD